MKNKKEFINVKDSFLTKEKFSLFLNEKSQTLSTFPKPSLEELPRYYDSTNYLSHKKAPSNLFSKIYFLSRRLMLFSKKKIISDLFSKPGKIVDGGSGTGYFLKAIKKIGWTTTGIEPNLSARNIAKKGKLTHVKSLKELKATNQDAITFWHSLEHVYFLEKTLSQAKEALIKNGFLIIACPNYTSWDAKHYKSDWAGWDVPRHLHHFSNKSLALILEPMGFVQIKKIPLLLDAFYISIISEQNRSSRFSFLKGMVIGGISNVLGLLRNNYSSHIYVFQKKEI